MKIIKNLITILIAGIAIVSCTPKSYNLEKTIKKDIEYIQSNFPDGVFYESEVVLNDDANSALYAKSVCNVFQSNDTAIFLLHSADTLKGKRTIIVYPHNFVMEDAAIEYPVAFSLMNAIKALRESDAVIPHSDKVTLRRPFGPNPDNNPQYIFGSTTDSTYAYVNANTGFVSNSYNYETEPDDTLGDWITNLDHDIYVGGVSCIEDDYHTGFDTWVGPTGWPWTDPVKWETALYEDKDFYYARLIFHEYMLWWSWDYPYIAVKFPKCNVSGDLRTNEKLRYQVLWDITYTTERSYSYGPYIKNAVVRHINGHTVTFGNYACRYEKYYVISDSNYDW